VTVEEAPVKVLKEIARTAMAKVPQLVGVTWSKELRRLMMFWHRQLAWGCLASSELNKEL